MNIDSECSCYIIPANASHSLPLLQVRITVDIFLSRWKLLQIYILLQIGNEHSHNTPINSVPIIIAQFDIESDTISWKSSIESITQAQVWFLNISPKQVVRIICFYIVWDLNIMASCFADYSPSITSPNYYIKFNRVLLRESCRIQSFKWTVGSDWLKHPLNEIHIWRVKVNNIFFF